MERPQPVLLWSGRLGKQSQRRPVLGNLPFVLCELWARCWRHRYDQGRVPCSMGNRSGVHWASERSLGTKMVDRSRNDCPGRRHLADRPATKVRSLADRCDASGRWYCDGLSHPTGRNQRCWTSGMASQRYGCLSLLARPRLCNWRSSGWSRRRPFRNAGGNPSRGDSDTAVRLASCVENERNLTNEGLETRLASESSIDQLFAHNATCLVAETSAPAWGIWIAIHSLRGLARSGRGSLWIAQVR